MNVFPPDLHRPRSDRFTGEHRGFCQDFKLSFDLNEAACLGSVSARDTFSESIGWCLTGSFGSFHWQQGSAPRDRLPVDPRSSQAAGQAALICRSSAEQVVMLALAHSVHSKPHGPCVPSLSFCLQDFVRSCVPFICEAAGQIEPSNSCFGPSFRACSPGRRAACSVCRVELDPTVAASRL